MSARMSDYICTRTLTTFFQSACESGGQKESSTCHDAGVSLPPSICFQRIGHLETMHMTEIYLHFRCAHYLASERLDILVRRVIVAEHLRDSALLLLGQYAFARPHLPVPVCSYSPHATGANQARKRRAWILY